MPNKIDRAYERSKRPEPLSGYNTVLYDTQELRDAVGIDMPGTRQFIEQQGLPGYYFQNALVHVRHSEAMPHHGDDTRVSASIRMSPFVLNGHSYFPYLALGVDMENLSEKEINRSFRHEIGHFVHQDTARPLYGYAKFKECVRSIGGVALAYGALRAGNGVHSLAEATATLACLQIGYGLVDKPAYWVSCTLPRELRAEHFARKHDTFNPIAVG